MVFERLFGDGGSPERRRAELKKSGSILDWMTSDMARLQRELGAGDRARGAIPRFRSRGRATDQRAEQSDASALPELDRPASVPAVWEDHVKLMFDLQVLALQADVTRVVTSSWPARRARGPIRISVCPSRIIPCRIHQRPGEAGQAREDQRHHVSLFAYLIEKLQATPDGDAARSHALSARQRHGES